MASNILGLKEKNMGGRYGVRKGKWSYEIAYCNDKNCDAFLDCYMTWEDAVELLIKYSRGSRQ